MLLHAYAMHGVQLGIEIMLEPYASWYQEAARDLRPLYDYQKKLMQLLDWQRPGERWLLKAPAHMWGLDALAATFPDVAIVWTHRDPVACIASGCSMTASADEHARRTRQEVARAGGDGVLRAVALTAASRRGRRWTRGGWWTCRTTSS